MSWPPQTMQEGPLLLLSPHLDDAALSCAALLSRADPIDVLTVFAGAPSPPRQGRWDRVTGFADSAESVPVRLAEERAAFAGSPHRLAVLSLLEKQYLPGPRKAEDGNPIAEAVSDWLKRYAGGAVALPAGAGRVSGRLRNRLRRIVGSPPHQHPDHLFVRDAGLSALASRPDTTTILYEEFPYRLGAEAAREVRRVERRRALSAVSLVVLVDREAKAARIAAYKTQVPHLAYRGKRVDVAEHLPIDERYWFLERAADTRSRSG